MIHSTTETIPGREISDSVGVVMGNVVQAKHIGRDIMAGLKGIVGGEIRGNFNVYYNGDSDSTDNAGPCQPGQTPNDCDWLNITMYKGQTKVFQHTENPWPADQWKNIQFSFFVEEGNETWDANNDNPVVEVTMKIKGDYQDGGFFGFPSGTPGVMALN